MKKYDVSLALASTKSIDKLALARMLIDMMELDELYEPLRYKGSFENLKKLDAEEYFDMLEIVPEERIQKIEAEDAGELKNYDVALSMSAAGNIDDAREVMEFLKPLNPKKPLDVSDFETIDKVSHILNEVTEKMTNAKEMLERKNMRDNLIKSLLSDSFSDKPLSEVSLGGFGKKRPKRKAIPKNIRFLVWQIYNPNSLIGECYCCSRPITFDNFDLGHDKAVADGGTDNISNLRPVCRSCNSSIGTGSIKDFKKKYFDTEPKEQTDEKEPDLPPEILIDFAEKKELQKLSFQFGWDWCKEMARGELSYSEIVKVASLVGKKNIFEELYEKIGENIGQIESYEETFSEMTDGGILDHEEFAKGFSIEAKRIVNAVKDLK